MTVSSVVDGRVTRGQRNREAIIDALLACYERGHPAPERRRGRGAGRRVGPFGAQPLRRRRGAARRGRAAPVGAALPRRARRPRRDLDATDRDRRDRASTAPAFFEAVTPVRRAALLERARLADDRARTSPGSTGACAGSSDDNVPGRRQRHARRARRDVVVGHVESAACRAGLHRRSRLAGCSQRMVSHCSKGAQMSGTESAHPAEQGHSSSSSRTRPTRARS